MLELIYIAVVVVCVEGECDSYVVDHNLTRSDCIARLLSLSSVISPLVPRAYCTVEGRTYWI